MKTNIAWNNHIMRKYGQSIRDEIERVALKTIIKQKTAASQTKLKGGYQN